MYISIYNYIYILSMMIFCSVISNASHITRYSSDASSLLLSRASYEESQVPVTVSQSFGAAQKSLQVSSKPFEYSLNCVKIQFAICHEYSKSIDIILERISKVFKIYEPIILEITLQDLSDGQGDNCDHKNILAKAAPAHLYRARRTGESGWSLYPQALLKQLDKAVKIPYANYDAIISINMGPHSNFWLPHSNKSISADEYDFHFTFSHELTHALGFIPGWYVGRPTVEDESTRENWLIPNFHAVREAGKTKNSITIKDWDVQGVFDNVLTLKNGKKLTEMAAEIKKFPIKNLNYNKLVTKFKSSGSPFNAAQEAYRQFTTEGTVFYSDGLNETLEIYTPQIYSEGSSMAHVAAKYSQSSEFLMVAVANDVQGETLDELISKHNKTETMYDMYGKQTLSLLTDMGWSTSIRDQRISVEVDVIDDENDKMMNEGSSLKFTDSGALIGIITLLLLEHY